MEYFLDCYLIAVLEGRKIRLKPKTGQIAPDLYVECSRTERLKYPAGTIYKADLKLIIPKNKKPFLMTRTRKLTRAIEFWELNKNLTQSIL
jgi:hypothetical protein